MWASLTYWVYPENADTPNQAIVSEEDISDIIGLASEERVTIQPVAATQPCESCEHLDRCMDSRWNERVRHGGPGEDAPISFVHTCLTCGNKTLSAEPDQERRLVPEGCFRWHPMAASALDCSGCMAEKFALQKQHPGYEAQVQMFRNLFEGGGVDSENAAEIANSRLAGLPMELLPLADQVLQRLLTDVGKRFGQAWEELGGEQQEMRLAEWVEQILLSIHKHPEDPGAVAHEFLLVFNDRPPFSQAWRELPVTHRRWVKQVWTGMVRQELRAA